MATTRPRLGIAHVTVVPRDPDDEAGESDADAAADAESDADGESD